MINKEIQKIKLQNFMRHIHIIHIIYTADMCIMYNG